ncbi:GlxA family transcriptional regulator [Micromonospora sp. NPDC023888]|uniref:GlxA family transcriptional regulator n=1 Tax=Micromonospora sp. NPDC023888 TaxID=3155607 RepID=UPI0033F4344E
MVNGGSHSVAILVYDGVTLLDVAGPAEVFKEANRFGADYRIVLLSPTGADVTSSLGIRMAVDGAVSPGEAFDTLLVAGSDHYPRAHVPADLANAARTPAAAAGRVASICTGAFVLAAAGVLDGKRATTHWKVAHELAARCPTCRVEPDAIYVRDGTTYTSAGVTAGIDLALALVEEDHGPDLTRDVARALVVYMQRAGGQSQFSAPLQGPPPRSPALRRITDVVTADPRGDHSLGELARHLNVSTRQLTRLFHDELSTTPARYVENIRFDLARALLDQGHTATQAATLAGFPSYESMRRVFARKLSISPAAYQRRFSTARRSHEAGGAQR